MKIKRLRHLLMSKCINNCEIRVPQMIGTMLCLQTLYGVYAGNGIANELSKLTQLRTLCVKRVSDDHAVELFDAIMKMEKLISLCLEAEGRFLIAEGRKVRGRSIKNMQPPLFPDLEPFSPPASLQDLTLRGILVEFPSWLSFMENLTSLSLVDSELSDYPTSTIQLLPKLKHLWLGNASKAKQIRKEFCKVGEFPMLETLGIVSRVLVEWTEIVDGAFPKLRSLTFHNCLRLRFLPDGLQYISTLEELKVWPLYEQDLARRLNGDENYKIKNIPYVRLRAPFM